ncbi:uncharacterized protein PGTG_12559 [Puccinia graminis f. sp. tritici CRL 75-36-700-3]|uniref:Uncharacterized protein n=1 Tax=Puccinia graminis f. sp. tritici (strain CRL 75-36-700-3 / race SCCL) TaxID=418459 RepID=E3KV12_PUCGT|nr:uncharacterized protein PGTG_12559 [Puccinia graminis f. sp. tritici CRL 75-36-700-3]EFP88112.2 hypothetical protein PGTG_12559 [Puccinia graminis f. sp. tritici CRL 75-36-700-3]
MSYKIGKFRRPLNPPIVGRLARYIKPPPRTFTEQQCVYLKNALAKHPDLAARFTTIIGNEDKIQIAEPGSDTVGSLADPATLGTQMAVPLLQPTNTRRETLPIKPPLSPWA